MTCVGDNVTGTLLMPDGTPITYDGLPNANFRLSFPKTPWMVLFCQGAIHPSVNVNSVTRPTPFADVNEIGEKLNYGDFMCSFQVDKGMRVYREIFNWMRRMTVSGSAVGETDDPLLLVNGVESIRYVGAWPTALGNLEFRTTESQVTFLTCSVTFNFDYFEFVDAPFGLN